MNKDTLKKHHFWILAGVVPLLALIVFVVLSSSVGGAIETKKKAIEQAQSELKSKSNPKPNELIKKLEGQNEELGKKRGQLWKENWDRQKSKFTWPANHLLQSVGALDLKFGDKIPNAEGEYDEFRKPENYLYEFSSPKGTGMADRVAPTQFNGSWQQVLRHVANSQWGERKLESDQIWLAMEDIWVQRTLLGSITTVNEQLGSFQRVPLDPANTAAPDNKLHRRFASRIWDVELWIEKLPDGKEQLRGKLTNITDRLQLLGIGNTMTLKVWLDDPKRNPSARPFEYRIGTEFLPGKGAKKIVKRDNQPEQEVPANVLEIVPTEEHIIDTGATVVEIAKVEQKFDARTVPVRRIDRLVLGYLDARRSTTALKKTEAMAKADEASAANAANAAATTGGGQGSSMPSAGGRGSGPGPGGGPGPGMSEGPGALMGGGMGSAGLREGGGTPEMVLDANRARYIEVSPNVRRMPVGIVLVIDQAFLQDVLIAFANSPLRFQITQVHWERFHGTLAGVGSAGPGGSSEGGAGFSSASGGVFGSGFGSSSEGAAFSGPKPGLGSSMGGPPRGPGPGPGLGGPPRPGFGSGPGSSFGGGPGASFGGPGGPGGALTTVSEAQLTSGLVTVSIYGIISLYEKYDAKVAAAVDAATTPKDTPKEPVKDVTPPKEGTLPPKEGTPKDTTPPKGETPKGETPKGETPKDGTPKEATPKDTTPKKGGQ